METHGYSYILKRIVPHCPSLPLSLKRGVNGLAFVTQFVWTPDVPGQAMIFGINWFIGLRNPGNPKKQFNRGSDFCLGDAIFNRMVTKTEIKNLHTLGHQKRMAVSSQNHCLYTLFVAAMPDWNNLNGVIALNVVDDFVILMLNQGTVRFWRIAEYWLNFSKMRIRF